MLPASIGNLNSLSVNYRSTNITHLRPIHQKTLSENFKAPAHYSPDPQATAEWDRRIEEAKEHLKSLFPDWSAADSETESPADKEMSGKPKKAGESRKARAIGTWLRVVGNANRLLLTARPHEAYAAHLDILDDLPFRREIFSRELIKSKLDPDRRIPIVQTMPGGIKGVPPKVVHTEKSLIDICLDNQLSTFPLNFATSEREYLKHCPDNKIFFDQFQTYWQKQLREIAQIVTSRLSALGVDFNTSNAAIYQPVACCRSVKVHVGDGQLGEPDFITERISVAAHRGFIVYVEQGKQAFSISLAEERLEIKRVPLDDFQQLAGHHSFTIHVAPGNQAFSILLAEGELEIERIPVEELNKTQADSGHSWISDNKGSFFSKQTIEQLEKEKFYATRMTEPAPIRKTVNDLSKALLIPREPILKQYAYGETNVEATIHSAREMLVPCYVKTRDELIEKCAVDIISLVADVADYFRLAKGAMTPAKAAGGLKQTIPLKTKARLLDDGIAPGQTPLGTHQQLGSALPARGRMPLSRAQTSARPVELIRRFPNGAAMPNSPVVRNELEKLNRLIRSDHQLERFICKPADRCAESLEPVVAALKNAGYETRSRAMYWWEDADDFLPENHFLVLARKDNVEYAIDLTAGQYSAYGITDMIIDTEAAWAKRFQEIAKGKLVKYKDFQNPIQAKNAFYSGIPVRPNDIIKNAEDAVVLSKPAWYGKHRRFRSVYKYAEPEGGIIERIGRRYLIKAKHNRPSNGIAHPRQHTSPVERVAAFVEKRGNWNSGAGDLAVQAVVNILRREIEIFYPDPNRIPTRLIPMPSRGGAMGDPIQLYYTGNHYDALIEGKRIPVAPDGDCLFRAVLRGLGREDTHQDIQYLRKIAAQDIRSHADEFRAL
ncbi:MULTISPECIES: hypothetical protein [Chelativorans]|jgi:hypothetical protein|uniref:OTU domain-containing protein n=1 Tax=Chelativorans sp. (strain BNC1) TaxID=266779 RepID=Q11CI7_CHESB|nr:MULTISPECIES: hypothetical protein [Chelativorans]